jgi:hypothetical protein
MTKLSMSSACLASTLSISFTAKTFGQAQARAAAAQTAPALPQRARTWCLCIVESYFTRSKTERPAFGPDVPSLVMVLPSALIVVL